VDSEGQDEMPDDYIGREAEVTIDGEAVDINLVASKPRYWLYKKVMKPTDKIFDPRQV
jgi:hypothetical protein